ncbi:hypothetical protein ABKN59_007632 [Abortiporus biennis]
MPALSPTKILGTSWLEINPSCLITIEQGCPMNPQLVLSTTEDALSLQVRGNYVKYYAHIMSFTRERTIAENQTVMRNIGQYQF